MTNNPFIYTKVVTTETKQITGVRDGHVGNVRVTLLPLTSKDVKHIDLVVGSYLVAASQCRISKEDLGGLIAALTEVYDLMVEARDD